MKVTIFINGYEKTVLNLGTVPAVGDCVDIHFSDDAVSTIITKRKMRVLAEKENFIGGIENSVQWFLYASVIYE